MVKENGNSTLNFALLGLIWLEPRSGYDLRKFFSSTPLISFSDSPGAIYPALRRLEKRGLVRGQADESGSRRGRKTFKLTTQGRTQFKHWQAQRITRNDLVRDPDGLMLRFAFIDQSLGGDSAVHFLRNFREELLAYLPTLRQFWKAAGKHMPQSGRLALEYGIHEYEGRLRWTRVALAAYGATEHAASSRKRLKEEE